MNLSIERVITILSPLFTALSGAIVAWVAKNFPGGPQLDPLEVSGLFALGAAAGIAALLKWVHGRASWVELHDSFEHERQTASGWVTSQPVLGATIADVEKVVTAHEDQIVSKVAAFVHAPASAAEVADEILAAAAAKRAAANVPPAADRVIPVRGPLAHAPLATLTEQEEIVNPTQQLPPIPQGPIVGNPS